MHGNELLFYIFGIGLAVSAVVFSFLGLKVKNFPGRAFPAVIAWFAILAIGATTFSVLHAQDEEQAKAAENEIANEEFEADAEDAQAGEAAEAVLWLISDDNTSHFQRTLLLKLLWRPNEKARGVSRAPS